MSTPPKSFFEPLKRPRTFEIVSNQIKQLIFDGVFKSGDRLPPETELAQQFNVGRQSVREALRILELSGFIIIQKGGGGGAIIKDGISEKITGLFMDAFQMEKIPTKDFTLARIEIERLILSHAIRNADESDIQKLKENLKETKEKIKRNQVVIDENVVFHKLLAKASKNQLFVIVSNAIVAAVRQMLGNQIASESDPKTRERWHNDSIIKSKNTLIYHEKIIEALIERDEEKAAHYLEEHLIEVKDRLALLNSQS